MAATVAPGHVGPWKGCWKNMQHMKDFIGCEVAGLRKFYLAFGFIAITNETLGIGR